jgi:hypothetical protein
MGLVVASLSLMVSAFGVIKLTSPAVDDCGAGKELAFGFGVFVVVAGSFVLAIRLTCQPGAAASIGR